MKLLMYLMSTKSDLYEFKIDLFDNDDPDDLLCSFLYSTWIYRRHIAGGGREVAIYLYSCL